MEFLEVPVCAGRRAKLSENTLRRPKKVTSHNHILRKIGLSWFLREIMSRCLEITSWWINSFIWIISCSFLGISDWRASITTRKLIPPQQAKKRKRKASDALCCVSEATSFNELKASQSGKFGHFKEPGDEQRDYPRHGESTRNQEVKLRKQNGSILIQQSDEWAVYSGSMVLL